MSDFPFFVSRQDNPNAPISSCIFLSLFFFFKSSSSPHCRARSRLTYTYGNTRISAGTQSAHLSHNRALRWPVPQARDACRSNPDCIIDTLNLEKRPSSRSLPIASKRGVSIKRRPRARKGKRWRRPAAAVGMQWYQATKTTPEEARMTCQNRVVTWRKLFDAHFSPE